jgi:hypothetical protein
MIKRRARVIPAAIALLGAALPLGSIRAHADQSPEVDYEVVDSEPARILLDASTDGRYVLTTAVYTTERKVIDRVTGAESRLSQYATRLSGDGKRAIFSTGEALLSADQDDNTDVYAEDVATGSFTLLTPDGDWSTGYDLVDVDFTGSTVVVRGADGVWARTAAFVSTAERTTEISFPGFTNSGGLALSDDGTYALFYSFVCKAPHTYCLGLNEGLFGIDLTTGVIDTLVEPDDPFEFSDAALSADGRCVVVQEWPTARLHKACRDGAFSLTPISPPINAGDLGPDFSVSRDGTVVTWTAPPPPSTTDPDTEYATPQVFRRVNLGPAEMLTVPATNTPDGRSSGSLVVGDGSTILVQTVISSRDPNVPTEYQVVARVESRPDLVSPPELVPDPLPLPLPMTSDPDPESRATPAAAGASVFTARTPLRVVDTRTALGYRGPRPVATTKIVVPVRGANGVAANATAVAVQLTATGNDGPGYVSALPSGGTVGLTSNLNLDTANETIANMAIVPIGPDGSITVYVSTGMDIIVDLLGWWTPAASEQAAGRFLATGPSRVLDTRPDYHIGYDGVIPSAGSTVPITVLGKGGVPATGVAAVSVNITLTSADRPGFVQAAPLSNLVVAASSTLNVATAGQTIAASAIVPVDAMGRIGIYVQPSTHVIVDVNGWFTDASAASGVDGMFVPLQVIRRAVDTRVPTGYDGPKPTIGTRFDVNLGRGAAVGNVAVTGTVGAGFVQLGPAATMVNGSTSSINSGGAEETIANAFITPLNGGLGVFTNNGTHIVIDVSGYMTP